MTPNGSSGASAARIGGSTAAGLSAIGLPGASTTWAEQLSNTTGPASAAAAPGAASAHASAAVTPKGLA
ncbi:hypothetical protein ACFQV2_14145 [Actinokineospora soli]|uniref:Uncharacterized protein n=1 Tax=Actinokineospora soli TaxID=1048753 RepID=A0ABW2TM95_9PSEU